METQKDYSILSSQKQLITPMTSEDPGGSSGPTIYSSLIAQAQFHLATNGVSNRLLTAPAISAADALSLNDRFLTWAENLPDYLRMDFEGPDATTWIRFARHKLWWRCWNLQIIMFRPILLRNLMKRADKGKSEQLADEEERCTQLCLQCVQHTIASISRYAIEAPLCRLAAWYCLYDRVSSPGPRLR